MKQLNYLNLKIHVVNRLNVLNQHVQKLNKIKIIFDHMQCFRQISGIFNYIYNIVQRAHWLKGVLNLLLYSKVSSLLIFLIAIPNLIQSKIKVFILFTRPTNGHFIFQLFSNFNLI